METQWIEIGARKELPTQSVVEYLNPRPNAPAIVRFCGRPFKYYKWWQPISAISPGPDLDPLWKSGLLPQARFAVWVIDRADTRIKILAIPEECATRIGEWARTNNRGAGDKSAPDFRLTMVKGDRVWWKVEAASVDSPITIPEMERLRLCVSEHTLADLYKPDAPERIQFLLDAARANPRGSVPGSRKWQEETKPEIEATCRPSPTAPFKPVEAGEVCDY